ncbi:MAG: radical SAM protein [Bacillota bacterium]
MKKYNYIYGPVPSRRMGISLGISPILKKICNLSCVYCQLGKTKNMTNTCEEFIAKEKILSEINDYLTNNSSFDVITIVGEGEPTLYLHIDKLINLIKKSSDKPVAVITNGALLYKKDIRKKLMNADIVLPSFDAYNQKLFKKINRPFKKITFNKFYNGLIQFSKEFEGQIWIEIMLLKDINDDIDSIRKFKKKLTKINYKKIFINTPVRPPAETYIKQPNNQKIKRACEILKATSINNLISEGFDSINTNPYQAILSIIKRHPMNQHEIDTFLKSKDIKDIDKIFTKLDNDKNIKKIEYMGYNTYKIKKY